MPKILSPFAAGKCLSLLSITAKAGPLNAMEANREILPVVISASMDRRLDVGRGVGNIREKFLDKDFSIVWRGWPAALVWRAYGGRVSQI